LITGNSGLTFNGTSLVVTGNITGSGTISGSFVGNGAGLYNIPASGVTGLQLDKIASGAVTASVSSAGLQVNSDTSITGSLTVSSGSATRLGGDLFVSGNLQVLGSSTNVNIQSTTVEIGDNIILVNAYSPFQRYAGIAASDSGSVGQSGSMLWDSTNNRWLTTDGSNSSSLVVGITAGSMGTENTLTTNTITKATSASTIGDSALVENGTTLNYNSGKFVVTGSTGDMSAAGFVTFTQSGSVDLGSTSSKVVFKNSSNVLGYVSASVGTNVTTGFLGYNSSGVLEFTSVIDGGTF
jgi:hypothetical protein